MSASTPDNNTVDHMSHSPPSASSASASAPRRPPRKCTLTQQQKNQKRQRATQEQLIVLEAEFSENPTPTAHVRERIADKINMTERSVQIWFQNRCVLPCPTPPSLSPLFSLVLSISFTFGSFLFLFRFIFGFILFLFLLFLFLFYFTSPDFIFVSIPFLFLLPSTDFLRCRRAKIKTMAKKSIEAGEDYDYSISDSMRQYLANQAMETGKGFLGFFDRQRLSSSYGNGSMMMANEPQHQSKISTSAQPPEPYS